MTVNDHQERAIGLVPPSPNRKPHPANGMTAQVHCGDGAYMTIVAPDLDDSGSAEWVLRYGNPEEIRFTVASVLSSYEYLLADGINMTEAMRRLRLLRRAYAELCEPERAR